MMTTPNSSQPKFRLELEGARAPAAQEKNVPLHRAVANKLMAAIQDGTYPVGSLLPTENKLAAKFKISRHTLRESVRQLQALNLVTRRQGHGTIVKSDRVQREFKLAIRTFSDVENHGYFTHLVLLRSDIVTADARLARELGCEPGQKFLHAISRRVPIDDTIPLPTAWNETYIIEPYAGIRNQMGMQKGPIYNLIERTFGERINAIEQDVSAVELTSEVARVLSARPRSPGLRVKRTYFGRGNRPVMIGYNTYPAEPFRLNMRLEHD
jgi:DNA-binding GntR family transcriptional regulator